MLNMKYCYVYSSPNNSNKIILMSMDTTRKYVTLAGEKCIQIFFVGKLEIKTSLLL